MINPIHTISDKPILTSYSQESPSLVNDESHEPCKGHLISKCNPEPFPRTELLPHGDSDHHARHIEENEGDKGIGGERREGATDHRFASHTFFVLFYLLYLILLAALVSMFELPKSFTASYNNSRTIFSNDSRGAGPKTVFLRTPVLSMK